MATFNFDQIDNYVTEQSSGGIKFFKLDDDGWQAKVRFMYGPGEVFQGIAVHNISPDPKRSKYIPCLRGLNEPLDTCPLCKAGVPARGQFYIPVYVISITKCIAGQLQPEEPVNQVMIFQRGKTFVPSLQSALRQSNGTPLCQNIFNIVRSGKNGDMKTSYTVEFVNRDDTTMESLGEAPQVLGSPLLPSVSYDEMFKYIPTKQPSGVVPRSAGMTYNNYQQSNQGYNNYQQQAPVQNYNAPGQAPAQAPRIPF